VFEKMCKYIQDLGVCDVNYTTSNFKVASSFLTRLLHSTVTNWLQDQKLVETQSVTSWYFHHRLMSSSYFKKVVLVELCLFCEKHDSIHSKF